MSTNSALKLPLRTDIVTGDIVKYPSPPVEKIRERAFEIVDRLQRDNAINSDEAREWKENLRQDLDES